MNLKLYVWEGVLSDYYPGMAVAVARNIREARAAVRKAYGIKSDYLEQDLRSIRPTVVRLSDTTRARAWTVSGGG